MKKEEISQIFYHIADVLESQGVAWKPIAYRKAARSLENLKEDVDTLYKREGIKGIEEIQGVGEALAKKIIQYIETGKIDSWERLKKTLPKGFYNLLDVPGLGIKKAKLFYEKLKIKSIEQLEKAAKAHKLIGLPGFKEKSEKNILEGIELLKKQKGRIPYLKAKKIADKIVFELKKLPEVEEAIAAGSLRRKMPTIGDLDIVVKTKYPEKVIDKFVKMKFVKKIIGKGKEKATIITKENVQADLRVFTESEFGAGLLYFTGDKEHNIWLRKIAIKKGMKLNEYGLFRGSKRIAGRTEQEIYQSLNVKMPIPEKRIGASG
jgi:DNA polymerase (family 10)